MTLPSSQSHNDAPVHPQTAPGPMESLYVASRHITFVHLPHQLDVFEAVDNHVSL